MATRFCFIAAYLVFSLSLSAQEIEHSLARIWTTRSGQVGAQMGTGFFISQDGLLATAYHVVQGASTVEVYTDKGRCADPVPLKYDADWDLALLKVEPSSCMQAVLAVSDVPSALLSHHGAAYGFPDGSGVVFRADLAFARDTPIMSGKFLGPHSAEIFAESDIQIIPIDATLNPGMSGGPIVVNGKAIGVISGSVAPQGRTFGWAIPISRLRRLGSADGSSFAKLPPLRMLSSGIGAPLLKLGVSLELMDKLPEFRKKTAGVKKFLDSTETVYRGVLADIQTHVTACRDADDPVKAIDASKAAIIEADKIHDIALPKSEEVANIMIGDLINPLTDTFYKEMGTLKFGQYLADKDAPPLYSTSKLEEFENLRANNTSTKQSGADAILNLKQSVAEGSPGKWQETRNLCEIALTKGAQAMQSEREVLKSISELANVYLNNLEWLVNKKNSRDREEE